MKQRTLEAQLYILGIWFLLAGAVLFLWFDRWYLPRLHGMACVFDTALGLYCPGCGGTRALRALLGGHFLQSLWYHPAVPYSFVLYGGFMTTQTLERLTKGRVRGWKFHDWYLYGMIGVILFHVVFRNVLRLVFHIYL